MIEMRIIGANNIVNSYNKLRKIDSNTDGVISANEYGEARRNGADTTVRFAEGNASSMEILAKVYLKIQEIDKKDGRLDGKLEKLDILSEDAKAKIELSIGIEFAEYLENNKLSEALIAYVEKNITDGKTPEERYSAIKILESICAKFPEKIPEKLYELIANHLDVPFWGEKALGNIGEKLMKYYRNILLNGDADNKKRVLGCVSKISEINPELISDDIIVLVSQNIELTYEAEFVLRNIGGKSFDYLKGILLAGNDDKKRAAINVYEMMAEYRKIEPPADITVLLMQNLHLGSAAVLGRMGQKSLPLLTARMRDLMELKELSPGNKKILEHIMSAFAIMAKSTPDLVPDEALKLFENETKYFSEDVTDALLILGERGAGLFIRNFDNLLNNHDYYDLRSIIFKTIKNSIIHYKNSISSSVLEYLFNKIDILAIEDILGDICKELQERVVPYLRKLLEGEDINKKNSALAIIRYDLSKQARESLFTDEFLENIFKDRKPFLPILKEIGPRAIKYLNNYLEEGTQQEKDDCCRIYRELGVKQISNDALMLIAKNINNTDAQEILKEFGMGSLNIARDMLINGDQKTKEIVLNILDSIILDYIPERNASNLSNEMIMLISQNICNYHARTLLVKLGQRSVSSLDNILEEGKAADKVGAVIVLTDIFSRKIEDIPNKTIELLGKNANITGVVNLLLQKKSYKFLEYLFDKTSNKESIISIIEQLRYTKQLLSENIIDKLKMYIYCNCNDEDIIRAGLEFFRDSGL